MSKTKFTNLEEASITFLHTIVATNNFEEIERFFNIGSQISTLSTDNQGRTVIHYAAINANPKILEILLKNIEITKAIVSDANGDTPMSILISRFHSLTRAKVVEPENIATIKDILESVYLLLSNTPLDAIDAYTIAELLHYAKKFNINGPFIDFLELELTALGAEDRVEITPKNNNEPTETDNSDEKLTKKRKISEEKTEDIKYPLHQATKEGNIDKIVAALSQKSVEINGLDSEGNTALLYAVMSGDKMIIKYLFNAGANTTQALDYALNNAIDPSLIELLLPNDQDLTPNDQDPTDQLITKFIDPEFSPEPDLNGVKWHFYSLDPFDN